ncbi:peptidoglycan-binding domain-containing protein [Aquimarina megaterium]|uniref:peptidoglycan-binding domain-containing protein n=1 Tax=Aquimarina megaterium TaxID=1443666 RepID=UPI000470BA6D|nr:LPXTG cell wall anchor domain-containing protein [Aquimarina megaterium]
MGVATKKSKGTKSGEGDGKIWIGIGFTALLLGGVGYWYYKKRKEKETELFLSSGDITNGDVDTVDTPVKVKRFRCVSSAYPLEYGTCHRDVKVLQSYITKIHKDSIGIDGMYGNKTNKAAKKYLQKAFFTKQDINGMRTALKTIKR